MASSIKEISKGLLSDYELREVLYTAIKSGTDGYKNFMNDKPDANNRGIVKGWFFSLHHGRDGDYRATRLSINFHLQKDNLDWNHATDMLHDLDCYFADPNTRYGAHSLAVYILDELNTIVGIQPTKPGRQYSPEDWHVLSIKIKELAATEALIPPDNHLPVVSLYAPGLK